MTDNDIYILQSTVYSLQSSVCSLQSVVYSLQSTVWWKESLLDENSYQSVLSCVSPLLSPKPGSQVWRPDSCLHPHYQSANPGRVLSPPTNGSFRCWEIFLAPLTAFIMHTMVVMVRPSDGISIVSCVQAESGGVRQMFAPTVCWVMWVFAVGWAGEQDTVRT